MLSKDLVLQSIPYTAHIIFSEDLAVSCVLDNGTKCIKPLELPDDEYYKFLKEFCIYVDYELSKEEKCEN